MTTVRMLSANWPAGGGGYFRLLPYRVSRWSIRRVNAIDRQPAMFYFHPWELDPGTAARRWSGTQGPVPPLREPGAHGAAAASPAARLPVGPGRSRVPFGPKLMGCRRNRGIGTGGAAHDRPRIRARTTRRAGRPSSTAAPTRRSSTASAGARSSRASSVIGRTISSPSAAAQIVGMLPLAEVRSRLFGHTLVSLPFCVYGGPAADDADAERALIDAASELARSLDVDHLELRDRVAEMPGWPRQDLYVTFRKEILPDVETNLLAIPRKQRAMVRKGIKHGLKSEIDASRRPLLRAVCGQRPPARHAAVRQELLRAPARGVRRATARF